MFAFPGILALHAIGMGFAVGVSAAIDLRILGVAPHVPLRELRRFLPILWAGFWLNAVSGVLLLIGYPTKALTNPVFYLKLMLIAVAMVLLVRISRQLFATDHDGAARRLRRSSAAPSATASLICWAGAITAGPAARLHLLPAHPVALTMHDFQVWLVTTIGGRSAIADAHANGLGLADRREPALPGSLSAGGRRRHLRSAAAGRRKAGPNRRRAPVHPVGAARVRDQHRTGTLFILTEPDQYIYNPSFHFKLLFMTIGGLNAATFYLTSYRRVFGPDAPLMLRARARSSPRSRSAPGLASSPVAAC